MAVLKVLRERVVALSEDLVSLYSDAHTDTNEHAGNAHGNTHSNPHASNALQQQRGNHDHLRQRRHSHSHVLLG